ncbi:cupin-like domain-containing protein [Podospora appendiculata]|uniref:Cupin-like domain-containing protein n=1 Tax=Podospora appendiculata TaxID=314037 RepID=A0AAE0X5U5_9PEZI|nr:cupin-like domain-containing protein [Podospora appendiculata]
MEETQCQDPIAELIVTYKELNGSVIEELYEEPSPLEFMRYVAKNTPFVVRGAAANWKATKTWSAKYLGEHLKSETVNVAVTPMGNADAPTPHGPDGSLVFAKPWEEDQPFGEFLDYVVQQERGDSLQQNTEVRYAQTQNDNLRHEYASLFDHVQRDIPFARIALQRDPEAINMWIGNSRSVTALHKDNYENIYVQIAGRKHFALLPPLCHPCVNEQRLQPSHYERCSSVSSGGRGEEEEEEKGTEEELLPLRLELETDGETVPFAIWDPDRPADNTTTYSHLAEPVRVTLEPGDMLYLPCMW